MHTDLTREPVRRAKIRASRQGAALTRKQSSAPRRARLLFVVVAVAQTSPGGLTGAFLRAGSKKPQVVPRPRRVLPSLGAASPLSDRHSERSPGVCRRLCATATRGSETERPFEREASVRKLFPRTNRWTRQQRFAAHSRSRP